VQARREDQRAAIHAALCGGSQGDERAILAVRHRASTHIVLMPVPTMGQNLGWLRRPPPHSYPQRDGKPPPNLPPQPIPSREAREALNEAKRIISRRRTMLDDARAERLLRELEQRKRA
jgi:hypothetical protein